MKLRKLAASMVLALSASVVQANEQPEIGEPIPIYTEAELIKLINNNQHLERVKADNCQLVEDIVARATRISLPAYEFLDGDMLAWGVCVNQDVELGLYYMEMPLIRVYQPHWNKLVVTIHAAHSFSKIKSVRFLTYVRPLRWATSMRVFTSLSYCCVITAVRWIMKMPTVGCITRSRRISVPISELAC